VVGFSSLARGHGLRGDGVLCRAGVGVALDTGARGEGRGAGGGRGTDRGAGEAGAWIGPAPRRERVLRLLRGAGSQRVGRSTRCAVEREREGQAGRQWMETRKVERGRR
jgi:hypothetical protein